MINLPGITVEFPNLLTKNQRQEQTIKLSNSPGDAITDYITVACNLKKTLPSWLAKKIV